MTLVFGNLVNTFNAVPDPASVASMSDEDRNRAVQEVSRQFTATINKTTLWFVYLFVGKFVLVYLHTTCFTIAATRMTRRLRLAYIKSILRQEIAYFDVCTPGSVATRISTNGNLIQTGLGERVGIFAQGISMLGSAFIVAFTQCWKLTLVIGTTVCGEDTIKLALANIFPYSFPLSLPWLASASFSIRSWRRRSWSSIRRLLSLHLLGKIY